MKSSLTVFLFLLISTVSIAQKSTSDALTLRLLVNPAVTLEPSIKTYSAQIETPIFALTLEEAQAAERAAKEKKGDEIMALRNAEYKKLEGYKNTYLSIPERTRVETNGDLSVIVKTSKTNVTHKASVPLSQLKMQDEIFRFTVFASLQIFDKTGKQLQSSVLVDSAIEISVVKASLYSDLKTLPLSGKRAPETFVPEALVLEKIMMLADQSLADAVEIQQPQFIVGLFSVKGKAFAPLAETQKTVQAAYGKFNALSKKNRITKEEMGKVLTDAQVVWEKFMTENKSEMDDRAYKGLALNCALASAWNNDFEKARSFLSKLSPADLVSADPLEEDAPQEEPSFGATIILSFEAYAANLQKFIATLSNNAGRVEFVQ